MKSFEKRDRKKAGAIRPAASRRKDRQVSEALRTASIMDDDEWDDFDIPTRGRFNKKQYID